MNTSAALLATTEETTPKNRSYDRMYYKIQDPVQTFLDVMDGQLDFLVLAMLANCEEPLQPLRE